jgi:hypothetical protein
VSLNVSQLVAKKNRCGSAFSEWSLAGTVTGNTVSPAVKGKVKIFACVNNSTGVVTGKKPVKL